MGARICPGCATRVDERRAKTSPYCLRCGSPLGPPSPVDGGRSSTFAGKPGAGGGSVLPWILGGIGLVVLLGLGGVIALIAVVSSNASPEPPSATVASQPKVEAPPTATVGATGATAATVKVPVPTVRTTVTTRPTTPPTPTTSPTPFPTPPPPPTVTPTVTPTGTGSGGVVVLAPFNRSKAQSEVDRVGATLASCSRTAGPFGAGSIRVDFEPDGRTGTLSRPPFAGTAVGSCISARFLAIRIGPFSGSTQNIEKAFIIQQ